MQSLFLLLARLCLWLRFENFFQRKVEQHTYSHPHAIIGAGYNGIKTAMFLEQANNSNYIVFDRYDRVGGHCWLEMANKTTKLQTEFPTYHVWYGKEFSSPGIWQCGGPPTKHEIWPSCDQLLEHFQRCAEDWGLQRERVVTLHTTIWTWSSLYFPVLVQIPSTSHVGERTCTQTMWNTVRSPPDHGVCAVV